MKKKLRVIDFFCGAGGFSEGFRQQGFDVVMGLDHWRPAVTSHNLNHGLEDEPHDILKFGGVDGSTEAIDALPNVEVIVGSPPCVSFSMANRAGKSEKGLGIQLIESYLRVIAVKKHQPDSILKAWLMENVPNSRNFVKEAYSFKDLNLASWARSNNFDPSEEALRVRDNGSVLCAADFGSPQSRKRFVCGEWVESNEFPTPKVTHSPKEHVTLGQILKQMPSPQSSVASRRRLKDPNYPSHKLSLKQLPDHFYDTGVYSFEWRSARQAKVNHPYMGRMSFPEAMDRPARTIMATRSASTREALILDSAWEREGDGQYRLPTVREAATLMGFPLAYQFVGSEGTKWKQIGNAVCPHMSAALAIAIRKLMGKRAVKPKFDELVAILKKEEVSPLNTFSQKPMLSPPRRKADARYRGHPFKNGNLTIALTNLPPEGKVDGTWWAVAYLGAGKTYSTQVLHERNRLEAWRIIKKEIGTEACKELKDSLKKSVLSLTASGKKLQQLYSENDTSSKSLHPADLMDRLRDCLEPFDPDVRKLMGVGFPVVDKADIHLRQVMAVAAVCDVAKKTNPAAWRTHSENVPANDRKVRGRLFNN